MKAYLFFQFQVDFYECFGFSLSDWAKYAVKLKKSINGGLIGALEYFSAIDMMVETHTTELKKIRSGFLLKEMLNRFKDMIISPNGRLLWIYSAHDITIVNFLNSLNVYEVRFPSTLSEYMCFFFNKSSILAACPTLWSKHSL